MILTMTNLSEQKIIVCCDFTKSIDEAVIHGARIAGIFGKELCLFYPVISGEKKEKQDVQMKLGKMIRNLKARGSDLSVSSLTLEGDLADSVEHLAEDYDGIVIVTTTRSIQEKLMALRQSSVPFLFVQGAPAKYLQYNQVMLPVGDSKAAKNAALWATYFGRFNQADIEILMAREKNEEQQKRIKTNSKAISELFSTLNLHIRSKHTEMNNDLCSEAVITSLKEQINLLIIPGGEIRQTDDLFAFPEIKIIKAAGELPVLCVNPNRDMYILCD